jgi:hypothetical protein
MVSSCALSGKPLWGAYPEISSNGVIARDFTASQQKSAGLLPALMGLSCFVLFTRERFACHFGPQLADLVAMASHLPAQQSDRDRSATQQFIVESA